jgi:amino acid transporter
MKLIAPILFLFLFLMPITPTHAADNLFEKAANTLKNTSVQGGLGDPSRSQSNTTSLISTIINRTVAILGVIAVLLIIYAGGLWLTAAGNDDKVATAKKIIRSTIVGVLIVGFSYAIMAFVLSLLLENVQAPQEEKGSVLPVQQAITRYV